MSDWMTWFVAAGVLAIFEIFTGTFYLLMIAVGLAAGGVAASLGVGNLVQCLVASVVGIAATLALRHTKYGKFAKTDAGRDPNVNMDVGQTLVINEWKNDSGKITARAMYRGAMWDIDLAPGASAEPGEFVIREVRGSRLIVANKHKADH